MVLWFFRKIMNAINKIMSKKISQKLYFLYYQNRLAVKKKKKNDNWKHKFKKVERIWGDFTN